MQTATAKAEEERMAPFIHKFQPNPFMGCTLDVEYRIKSWILH